MIFDRQAKYALLVACLTLLASSVGFQYAVAALNIYLRKEPVALRGSFATISRTIGGWTQHGEDEQLDEAILMELGTRDTLSRAYVLNGTILTCHIAYYTGLIDAVPHIPDRCFVAGGFEPQSLPVIMPLNATDSRWSPDPGPPNQATGMAYQRVEFRHPFTNFLESVRMPVGDLQLRITRFARKDRPGLRVYAGFLFIANGRAEATPDAIRALAFKPSERHAYYCKVQFGYSAPDATEERFVELVSDFARDFLPELMLRLPDWQEVEQREATRRSQP